MVHVCGANLMVCKKTVPWKGSHLKVNINCLAPAMTSLSCQAGNAAGTVADSDQVCQQWMHLLMPVLPCRQGIHGCAHCSLAPGGLLSRPPPSNPALMLPGASCPARLGFFLVLQNGLHGLPQVTPPQPRHTRKPRINMPRKKTRV